MCLFFCVHLCCVCTGSGFLSTEHAQKREIRVRAHVSSILNFEPRLFFSDMFRHLFLPYVLLRETVSSIFIYSYTYKLVAQRQRVYFTTSRTVIILSREEDTQPTCSGLREQSTAKCTRTFEQSCLPDQTLSPHPLLVLAPTVSMLWSRFVSMPSR